MRTNRTFAANCAAILASARSNFGDACQTKKICGSTRRGLAGVALATKYYNPLMLTLDVGPSERPAPRAIGLGMTNVEFRPGLGEDLPVGDAWADVIISNGVINLCADKRSIFSELYRVLRPSGYLQFADIANGRPVPEAAIQNIELWTA